MFWSSGSTRRRLAYLAILPAVLLAAGSTFAQWVEFVDETTTRISADTNLGSGDSEEKDYAWGDVDRDGDIDLVVVRKEPFTSPGKRINVLFLNESGVLVDRTTEFATSSDVPGDLGFKTATNDRDVQLVDVNLDDWLDIVTAVTISDGDPVHIGHPRIYLNLGEDGSGDWLGFRYEFARIPTMQSDSGQSGFNPRFCSVSAGDLTGDDAPELWFGDYDASGAGGFEQPPGADFNDRLLINDGTGFFTDETDPRFSGLVSIPGAADAPFPQSDFGAASAIADMNGDGFNDIVKQTSLTEPLYVGIAYNTPDDEGFFDTYDVVNDQSPYFISVGDLNNDSMLDIVITDDGADRYVLNQGNGLDQIADFLGQTFSFDAASDDGFGGNSLIVDLNNDGWNDVLIADVDVDTPGCSRRMHIYRNLGGAPGSNVVLQEQTTGTNCNNSAGNPSSCIVASIPANALEGVHDLAVFDIDGDGWKDMVLGRCSGTEVYMNRQPEGLTFRYPVGLPFFIEPGVPTTFQVEVGGFGGATPEPGTTRMFVSFNGGPFSQNPLVDLGDDTYEATIAAQTHCTDRVRFYFTADAAGSGETYLDPPGGATDAFQAIAALGSATRIDDGFEGDVSGWTVVNDASLETGAWEQAEPIGTVTQGGEQAAPDEDADASEDAVLAFVTENGQPGGSSGAADVDGGPTDLISPPIDLLDTDGIISYSRWYYSSGDDTMTVWVSADGIDWQLVETVTGNNSSWQVASFQVGNFITPSETVYVRFRAADSPNDSIVEAAVDRFRVDVFLCPTCTDSADCNDGVFCNGVEACVDEVCVAGSDPCPGEFCDEIGDVCNECLAHSHCDDGAFCNGVEVCTGNSCAPGLDPCLGQLCDESNEVCTDCLADSDCDDGLFCNGAETCVGGTCRMAAEACPGRVCEEATDICIGTVPLQPKMGQPLLGLTPEQTDRFAAGKQAFNLVFSGPEGLGPVFNQNSCGACHNTPLGGSGTISVTRFGFNDDKGAGFDPLVELGGSLLQAETIELDCAESIPPEANVTAKRVTPSTLGFGLIEAIPDAQISAWASNPPSGVSGRMHVVAPLENPTVLRVGRFGWKSQVATVLSFSGDATLNEMGITNRLVGQENAPNGDSVLLATCDTVADPEDGPDGEGLHFIDRVTDFQRFLAAPPQTPRSGMTGETVFNDVGCNSCHVSTFTTDDDPGLEDAIRDKTLKPYSDFLLHDMGLSADFIEQGMAGAGELRTAPLWGLRVRDPLWHDGRVAGGTFEDRVRSAILEHGALNSEGQSASQAFQSLPAIDQDALTAFLDSLGRAEFDADGNGVVNLADHADLLACFSGSGAVYTPDDPCSIHDPDQDGDVDDDDLELFVMAADVQSGSVPDGRFVAGTQLVLSKDTLLDEITLSWGESCFPGDNDYAIYQGSIGTYDGHVARQCSTAGTTTTPLPTPPDSVYFLVVPTQTVREGSYGRDSSGVERPPGGSPCEVQEIADCQ